MGPSPEAAAAEGAAAEPSADDLERGRLLFAQACTAVVMERGGSTLPDADLAEVAFAGRSNVGKSSLLNALAGRKALAAVSQTPGRTRRIGFYDLGGRLRLVDLPGYGYARAPRHVAREWSAAVEDYLRGRPNLRRALLLVDAQVGIKDSDEAALTVLDHAAVATQVVLTKADKLGAAGRERAARALEGSLAHHPAAMPRVLATSAMKGLGIPELRAALAALARPPG